VLTTRRELLRTGALGVLGLGLMGGLDAALAGPRRLTRVGSRRDPVLVFVDLLGGNDGLNTVVPLAQYDRYRALRPTLGWPREQLVPLPGYEQDFGLNPALQALVPVFEQGRLAIVNGVGFPATASGLFDHEASHQNLETAHTFGSASPSTPTGWVGRFLDAVEPGEVPASIDFGNSPLVLTGVHNQPLSLAQLDGFGIFPSADRDARLSAYRRIQALPQPPGVRARNAELRNQVLDLTGVLQTINDAYAVAPGVAYPQSIFAGALRDSAALIAADRGVRALGITLGGFDTHSGQNAGPPDAPPYHQAVLTTVVEAVAAFYADLQGHGIADRVVILIASEFGRRAAENNDGGTDHGFGSVLLALGDPVRGGVYGDYPDLRDQALVLNGNLGVHIDVRSVYATVLAQHLGVDPGSILDGDFPPLAFLG
jgi:uncharacterized protein (DUF1501 family)